MLDCGLSHSYANTDKVIETQIGKPFCIQENRRAD